MEALASLLQFAQTHPILAFISGGVLALYLCLLHYKFRETRNLEARIEQLRQERGDMYNAVRPLR